MSSILRGEFSSAAASQSYTFVGGASFFGNAIAGFAYLNSETPTACDEENDCLLRVFTEKDQGLAKIGRMIATARSGIAAQLRSS